MMAMMITTLMMMMMLRTEVDRSCRRVLRRNREICSSLPPKYLGPDCYKWAQDKEQELGQISKLWWTGGNWKCYSLHTDLKWDKPRVSSFEEYECVKLGKTSTEKKTFSFGHCPNHLNSPPWPQFGQPGPFFGRQKVCKNVGRGGRYINNLKTS